MDEFATAGSLSADLLFRTERVQQRLLTDGYTYVLGSVETWPHGDVVLEKEGRFCYLALWAPESSATLRDTWTRLHHHIGDAGLLLLGTVSLDDAQLAAWFTAVPGTVAYLDVTTGQYHLRPDATARTTPPECFSDQGLRRLLDPQLQAEVADVDCLDTLRVDLAERQQGSALPVPTLPGVIPWLTYTLIALCVLVFLYQGTGKFVHQFLPALPADITQWGTLFGPLIRLGEWWRLLSHAFLHGDIMHLGFNMVALVFFGAPLECWQGRSRIGALLLFSVFTGTLASLWWHPVTPSVGMSGGIFGLLGVFGAVILRYRQHFPPSERKELTRWLGNILLFNIAFSFLPRINMAAHLGGLAGGFLLGLLIVRPPFRPTRLPAWSLAGAIALVAATAVVGYYIIQRVPLSL